MNPRPIILLALLCLLNPAVVTACAGESLPTQPPQPPDEYLSNTLDWIETHSVKINTVDWAAVRKQAQVLALNPQTTAETYLAILFVMKQLGDSATFFLTPQQVEETRNFVGFDAFYPDGVIISVYPGGPADRAGLRVGDIVEKINGQPPKQFQGTPFLDLYNDKTLHITALRADEVKPITVTLEKTSSNFQSTPTGRRISTGQGNIGYIELPVESGGGQLYPTLAQQVIREADQAGACGWIIDLRRTTGGDIWSYIAAIGPILGEGKVGGFAYLDGTREPWTYEGGKVFWGNDERFESLVEGSIYKMKHPVPPVALLTSQTTMAAGELAAVTFQGRPNVRTFGESTGGSPFLVFWTGLSDGAWVGVSAAFAMDRMGQIYDGPITPDEVMKINWTLFGSERDPVILAATAWLRNQPNCVHG